MHYQQTTKYRDSRVIGEMLLCNTKKLFSCLLVLFLLFFAVTQVLASNGNLEYKVKAAYLYNFTKFVEWPSTALDDSPESTLNICVLGKDPFGYTIDLLNNKVSKGHKISVSYFDHVDAAKGCHVAFISKSLENDLMQVLQSLSKQPVLTVSDINGFSVKGGSITLDVVDSKVRFNINIKTIKESDLKVSAKLLELAKVVIE